MELPALSMGSAQLTVLVVTSTLSLIVIAFLAYAALQTRKDIPYDKVATVGYRFRRPWSLGLLLILMVIGALSFANMPSGVKSAHPADSTMMVTSAQFGFMMAPMEVTAGTTVAFEVTSTDVHHGFGVYSPSGELLGQTQAMPGRVNRLVLDIDEPGTYRVLCMEYCGLFHHIMMGTFTAAEGQGAA